LTGLSGSFPSGRAEVADGLLIVGGSYAAAYIAAAARQNGYDAPIRLVSEEPLLPYQRPPRSKTFLAETGEKDTLPLRAEQFYREQKVDVDLGVRVVAIDRAARNITSVDGSRLGYDKLALAVGARPRALDVPGAELEGVFTLRSLADARRIKTALADAENVVVIGAGFIGLEVASSAVKLGRRVSVLEIQDRPLGRACPPVVADWFANLHTRHGVNTLFGSRIVALRGEGGRVRAVTLAGGAECAADVVIAGIGVVPNVELALACGLVCDGGIVVDRFARTSDPDVVAAGDCTRFPSAYADDPVRLESVQDATDQARTAGATIAGRETAYDAVPWFWSDQYDVKLQMAGLSQGHDAYAVRGTMDDGKFSVFYFRGGTIVAVDSVNRPSDHMLARRLIAARASCSPLQAADASFELKLLLPRELAVR
jgi:3-phenylpropionate/trans-cinnamate dioxygenase ferredoxin reductase subunit